MAAPGSVYVVDDDASVRDAVDNLFRSVGLKVRTFSTAQQFLSEADPSGPSCLVLDVRLPEVSGLDLQVRLSGAHLQMPVIFITAHGDVEMSVRAMKAGAVEFFTKPFRAQDLLDAVQRALESDAERRRREVQIAEVRKLYDTLTSRERDVLELIVQGRANKQIAYKLNISEPTVKLHRGHLMRKMCADSLADLIRISEKLGIGSGHSA
jgi:FixJ family two-component response regulator